MIEINICYMIFPTYVVKERSTCIQRAKDAQTLAVDAQDKWHKHLPVLVLHSTISTNAVLVVLSTHQRTHLVDHAYPNGLIYVQMVVSITMYITCAYTFSFRRRIMQLVSLFKLAGLWKSSRHTTKHMHTCINHPIFLSLSYRINPNGAM